MFPVLYASVSKSLLIRTPVIELGLALMAQVVKSLPAMQETHVQSLDWEEPLEKGMATHSSILA